jgi:hypothetical protein
MRGPNKPGGEEGCVCKEQGGGEVDEKRNENENGALQMVRIFVQDKHQLDLKLNCRRNKRDQGAQHITSFDIA